MACSTPNGCRSRRGRQPSTTRLRRPRREGAARSEHANDSPKAAEAECAEGRTAPRISLGKIEDQIADVRYTTAAEAFYPDWIETNPGAKIMTLCLVTMRNGFMVIGDSCPMSP